MRKLVVLSGSGISAESGIKTFRDMGGLWEQYDVTEVASPQAWENNRQLVLDFYNQRRKQLFESEPNPAHYDLADLEKYFDLRIVTQNVDDLHERAGNSNVLHLHGELKKVRSTVDPTLIYEMDHWELKEGDICEKGSQLRPHIVWFGEPVDAIMEAAEVVSQADIFVVIGTSLSVYPAAGLLQYVSSSVPVYIIDPGSPEYQSSPSIHPIKEKASSGMKILKKKLLQEA
ncbi:SIR2 family NAD-dependent protein deacylase [Marinilabilia rubra]|uniref:protein acetyllysine N-acetyltransferase n=1 Tax=Marinilabilia rubra TaxID=2162893 RepID=A0A2U2B8U1_9BACT|nr:NAD-dependent deacylase [Marinilabilia rubra]PWD99462.1 NAD-dependent protein deacylase [Marinilabilia rubra]